jgi:protein CpxP
MSKPNKYKFIIIALLLANLIFLGFILLKGHKPHREPKRLIIEKLHFDEGQVKQYEKTIRAHRSQIDSLDKKVKAKKQAMYRNISDTQQTNVWTEEMAALQMEIERTHLNHFRAIQDICHPNQMNDFDELMKQIDRMFSPPRGREKPRR